MLQNTEIDQEVNGTECIVDNAENDTDMYKEEISKLKTENYNLKTKIDDLKEKMELRNGKQLNKLMIYKKCLSISAEKVLLFFTQNKAFKLYVNKNTVWNTRMHKMF